MLNIKTLTDTLSGMDLQELQDYARVNKNDPYIVSMALSMANTKKKIKIAQDGQAGMMPQPKVADQQIAQMSAPPPQQMLPEDQGIATLPAQNMQNMAGGGIVAFDDGGEVPGYAEGIFTGAKKKYKQLKGYEFDGGPEMFDKALNAEGVTDPKQRAFLKAIHAQESDQALNAPTRDKSGAMGPMQVTRDAWTDVSKKGDALKSRSDPFENMRAGIRYASTGWQKSAGNPVLAGAYYYGGPGGFAKAQKGEAVASSEDKGQTTLQYGKQISAKYLQMLPLAAATAAPEIAKPPPQAAPQAQGIATLASDPTTGFTVPQDVFSPSPEEERKYAAAQAQAAAEAKRREALVSQIPGQTAKAPAFKDTNTYFGGVADRMGIPLEVQRNVANTINATSGFTAPIGGVNRAAATVSKGLEPTAEMIQKAAQAKQIAETPRILPPAKAGLEALDEASAATRAAADNARRMRLLEQDRKAAIGAEQSVDAATKSAAIADKFAKEIALAQDAARLNQAKMTGAAQGLAMTQAADKANLIPRGGADIGTLTPNENIKESVFDPNFGGKLPPDVKKDIVDDLKEKTGASTAELKKQAADSGMDFNSFLFRFGLGLLAGESQYASVNAGKAGLGALDAELASQKLKQSAATTQADIAYKEAMAAQAKMPAGEVQMIERYANDPKFRKAVDMMAAAKREPMTRETLFKEYIKSPVASIKPFSEYVSEYEKEFGPLGAGVPTGVIVSRAGQT